MGTERQVIQGYLDALFKRAGDYSDYFADDVVASVEGTGQRPGGRQAVVQFVKNLHRSAFDAHAELKNLLVDDRKAAIEADFVGPIPGSSPGSRRPAGPSRSRTASSTTCGTTRSPGCACTFR